ncbi:MAG: DUF1080 domain-containing protein, partial [Candidatus Omnitrophica bacterium]|nr:DUF1080 domain-containing protein [Candidatus Omnitrophota bacterium]
AMDKYKAGYLPELLEYNIQGIPLDCKLEADDVVFRNGVIEFKALIEAGSQYSKAGVEFRDAGGGGYQVFLQQKEDGISWAINLAKGTSLEYAPGMFSTVYTTLASEDISIETATWNSFRVYAVGPTFKVWLNDDLVIDCNDIGGVIDEGSVSFMTGPGTAAAFDDLIVKSYVYEQGLAASETVTDNEFFDPSAPLGTDWAPWPDNGIWEQSHDGAYLIQKDAGGVPHMIVLEKPEEYADILADVDIKFDSGTDTAGGIIFRSDHNYENYLQVTLDSADGRVYLDRIDGMAYESIAFEQIPVQTDKWYHLKVKAIGEHIEIYVNGRKMFNAIDTQFDADEKGKIALFTGQGTRAGFKNIRISSITPFDKLLSDPELPGDEYTFLKKLNTLSRTKDFDANLRVNREDRILFEIIGSGDYTFSAGGGIPGINMQLLKDISSAVNLTWWNKETNTMTGDINSDGETDELDLELVQKISLLTSDASTKYYVEDVLGLNTANLSQLRQRISGQRYIDAFDDAIDNDDYTFTVMEFLIKYADLTGDGAVNYRDTQLFLENFMLYEFIAAMKSAMESIEFIPSGTFGPLSLNDFGSWTSGQKALFIERLNQYISTMDTSQAIAEFRDYNNDGKADFKDKSVWEHYSVKDGNGELVNYIDEESIIDAGAT